MDFFAQFSGMDTTGAAGAGVVSGSISPEILQMFATLTGIGIGIIWIVSILVSILMIISRWRIFEKSKLPGRGSLIPFYNFYLMFKVGGRPGLWFLWILFPPVFIVLMIILKFDIAKRFKKERPFAIGLLFLKCIFLPILAFDKSKPTPITKK